MIKTQILFIVGLFIFFSCKETKPETHQPSGSDAIKPVNDTNKKDKKINKVNSDQPESQNNAYFIYEKWNTINKAEGIYQKNRLTLQLKSYLDESKNIGGKKMYINNKEIDFIVSDAYVLTPFIFTDGYENILLIQEEDESGIYGYRLYYFDKEKLVKKIILDVAPVEDTVEINKFITFKNGKQNIVPIILTNQYYDTELYTMKPSSNYRFVISKTSNQ
ncbi:hypothetical protein [Chryseobacterium vaccae]|uniref:hypothetical protein n=1 Tax=Chryseobacterium vaccae TaxID=2604424 RepID=UPI0012977B0C|nr:hypothetical protein [Chryseobacterium vaccae]